MQYVLRLAILLAMSDRTVASEGSRVFLEFIRGASLSKHKDQAVQIERALHVLGWHPANTRIRFIHLPVQAKDLMLSQPPDPPVCRSLSEGR